MACALTALIAFSTAPVAGRAACPPAGSGVYTTAQAAAGKTIYDAHCSVCHRADLSGEAGPPLAGKPFQSWLQLSKITGAELFDFISTQMPYNAPGSLAKTQYHDVFAYVLSVNRYPAGTTSLGAGSLACLDMLPYPNQG
ncbi:MAG: c-type cytochrome [Acetobacteraceae bacterium]